MLVLAVLSSLNPALYVQIRVHLQFCGHPIANDMLYLSEQRTNRSAEGMAADKAAGLSSDSSVSDTWQNEKEEEPCIEFNTDPMCTNCPNLAPKGQVFLLFPILGTCLRTCSCLHTLAFACTIENRRFDFWVSAKCRCDGNEEALWLHCIRYSGPGWIYECPYPDWASLI